MFALGTGVEKLTSFRSHGVLPHSNSAPGAPGELRVGEQFGDEILGQEADHRGGHEARRHAHAADAVLRQVSRPHEREAGEPGLGRGVGGHPLLPLEAGDRAGVDDHPALAVGAVWRVGHHLRRERGGDVGRAEQVDLDHPAEAFHVARPVGRGDWS